MSCPPSLQRHPPHTNISSPDSASYAHRKAANPSTAATAPATGAAVAATAAPVDELVVAAAPVALGPPVPDDPGGEVVLGVRTDETTEETATPAQMAPDAVMAVVRSPAEQLDVRQGAMRGARAACLSDWHWQAVSSIAQPTWGTYCCRQAILVL